MKPPVEPSKEDCCNGGCNPCIYDVYEKQLKLYEKYKNSHHVPTDLKSNGILQGEYTSFVVTNVLNLCNLHKLVKFKKKDSGERVFWKVGEHFYILFKKDSNKCSRAYTPIKSEDDCDFEIIVKVYENGLVSNYLYNLVIGDTTLWRGPYGGYEVTPNKFNNIILIAQGTGIIPFISITQEILNNEDDMTKILLYYCTHSIDTILYREELYCKKSFWNFSYKVYLSSTSNYIVKYEEPILERKLNVGDIELLKPAVDNQYVICGSNEFMSVYKKFLVTNEISSQNIVLL
ncbi:NADH-cytochrome b5 reductase-like [Pieris rapae]|uniref:NADH-cytochrome b5 reductase-like n=1 Tax=Pieris rapae TaxID=64459 RepID=UPI001E27C904|nr:NADH-cytochrome b5 reductase-like [Pieris rapae]